MGQTKYYNLAFFDFGDNLKDSVNVQKEIERFAVIDKQIYGMYNIFGNGVMDGFVVQDAGFQEGNGISVFVSEGIGIINYAASQTYEAGYIHGLPTNSVFNIYATISGSTYMDRNVNFIYSEVPVDNGIRLATVSTGADGIRYIDNTVRDLIGFEEIVQDAIDKHKHRGTPSKIDLQDEVKNQMSGARIEGVDASKVISGKFGIDRIPLVDHNDLDNTGLLTHSALDSFVKTFSQNNQELLGEISSINLLKSIIFWKYKYSDADEFFINELALIPGISPDSFIDFDSSTANISLENSCISGYPSKSGVFSSVFWDDTFSFNTASFKHEVVIQNDTVFLDSSSSTKDIIANFSGNNQPFKEEMMIVENTQQAVIADVENDPAGRLGGGATLNYFYRINYNTGKNWQGVYDELALKIRTIEEIHAPVYMYVVNGSNYNTDGSGTFGSIEEGNIDGDMIPGSAWQILGEDESPTTETWIEKVFDIKNKPLSDVTQITIFTEDPFVFEIDDIEVRRKNILSSTGTINFQYFTDANVVFHSIFYDMDTPEGTSSSVRMKVASDGGRLSQAVWSPNLNSGGVISLSGTAVEIEVTMASDDGRIFSPTLKEIELKMLSSADYTGFVIDTETDWNQGDFKNISVLDSELDADKSVLNISTINIGGRYFSKSGSVSEMDDASNAFYGFGGSKMPVSPSQAKDWNESSGRGFSVVSSVSRLFDNSLLISDLNNNRVMQVDRNGNLIKGFGSTYISDNQGGLLHPLTASYRKRDKILTVVFSSSYHVRDITNIYMTVGTSVIYLSSEDEVISNSLAGGKILEIKLDDDTAVRLLGAESSNCFVNFDSGAFDETIGIYEGMKQGNAIYSDINGLACFVGDFTYINNIQHPILVKETNSGNWIIGNSSIFYDPEDTITPEPSVPDIIEIDPNDISNISNTFSSSAIKFSDFTLGGVYEYGDGKFAVAGIVPSDPLGGMTGQELLDKYPIEDYPDGPPESVKFRADGLDKLDSMAGRVLTIDTVNVSTSVFYSSSDGTYVSEIDRYESGDFIIAESSLADPAGRLARLDSYGNVSWIYGVGSYHIINDVRVLNDDRLIVSV
jgi:hypothetical protein